jgi:hypothetical protein
MAFGATARGNLGCPPEQYPHALAMVLDGKVQLASFVELHPLDALAGRFPMKISAAAFRCTTGTAR